MTGQKEFYLLAILVEVYSAGKKTKKFPLRVSDKKDNILK